MSGNILRSVQSTTTGIHLKSGTKLPSKLLGKKRNKVTDLWLLMKGIYEQTSMSMELASLSSSSVLCYSVWLDFAANQKDWIHIADWIRFGQDGTKWTTGRRKRMRPVMEWWISQEKIRGERRECFCCPPIFKLFTEHHAVRSALWNVWVNGVPHDSIINPQYPSSAACRRRIIFGSQQREAIVSMSSRNRCKIRRSVKVGLKTLHRENISCILPTLCSVVDITNN